MARPRSKNLLRLLKLMTSVQEELAEILEALLLNKSQRQTRILRMRAVKLIQGLRLAVENWLEQTLTLGILRYDREAIAALQQLGYDVSKRSDEVTTDIRDVFTFQTTRYLDKITGGLFSFVASVTSVREETLAVAFPDLLAKVQSADPVLSDPLFRQKRDQAIAALVRQRIREKMLPIVGSHGRVIRYPLQYYGTLIGHTVENALASAVMLRRAREFGHEFLQIEGGFATHGDFCDAYRKKVVSITGATAGFPLIGQLPNGGPPFHPWCKHRYKIFDINSVTDYELSRLRNIPEDLLLRSQEDTAYRIEKTWRSRDKV